MTIKIQHQVSILVGLSFLVEACVTPDPASSGIASKMIGEGPPIIISTGGPKACGPIYEKKLKELTNEFRLVFWDYRGCGKSDRSPSYSMDGDLRDLDAVVKSLGHRPYLFGHSYGGMLSLLYASKFPSSVRGLILVSTISSSAIYGDANREKEKNLKSLGLLREWRRLGNLTATRKASPADEKRYWQIELNNHFVDKSYIDEVLDNIQVNFDALLAMQSDINQFDITSQLGSIELPSLVVAGKHDLIVLDEPKRLHNALKNSTYAEFANSGHMPFVEENKEFIETLRSWLSRN